MALFDFLKNKKIVTEPSEKVLSNQIATDYSDGAIQIEDAVNSFIMNFDWTARSQAELIEKYREIATFAEVDYAIQDIVNEMVSFADDEDPVRVDLTEVELSNNIKDKIVESWEKISHLLCLSDTIHQRAERFYVDGRLAYQKVIDKKSINKGLLNVVELDPRFITKFRNVQYNQQNKTIDSVEEYFIYDENRGNKKADNDTTNRVKTTTRFKEALQLSKESITYVTSGMVDPLTGYTIGWLHKAIRPANQMRLMENALAIYRITRAPERRIFYVDTGNLPKSKAEQHVKNLQANYRNRMSYDPETGSFKDNRHLMTMQEDYWLPRTGGGRGTEVSTLQGGQNLGDMDDVLYFLKRLYKSLNIPTSRLEDDAMVSIGGRSQEISRDELKFSKFVSKVRKRFTMMFMDLLKTDLILTKVIGPEDWPEIAQKIKFIYAQDMYLEERKYFEMMRDRLELAKDMEPYVGKYFSHKYLRVNILQQTDEDIKENDKEIAEEAKNPQYQPDDESGGF